MDPVVPTPKPTSPENVTMPGQLPEIPAVGLPEKAPAVAAQAPVPVPSPYSNPVLPTFAANASTPAVASPNAALPVIADDVDVIEKEWVDRADEIRKQTVGDPHAEEEQIEILQQQYLKQRYGRDVGKPQDD